MIYANKKVQESPNQAAQTAKIIDTMLQLQEQEFVRIDGQTVWLRPNLWKNVLLAQNWMKCANIYCNLILKYNKKSPLEFRDIETDAVIGKLNGKQVKVLLFR